MRYKTDIELTVEAVVDDWLDKYARHLRGSQAARWLTESIYAQVSLYLPLDEPEGGDSE